MTIKCHSCGHEYGAWRAQCSACGTATPRSVREEMLKPRDDAKPKRFVSLEAPARGSSPRVVKLQCIFCRRRNAKLRCPHCNELVHKECLRLHAPDCAQFQTEREALLKTLNASPLHDPSGVAHKVMDIIRKKGDV